MKSILEHSDKINDGKSCYLNGHVWCPESEEVAEKIYNFWERCMRCGQTTLHA